MKAMIRILILAGFLAGMGFQAEAQTKNKFGHINSNDLLGLMPERDSANVKLQNFANELETQLTTMTREYENKVAEFQQGVETMSPLVREDRAQAIRDLEARIQQFQGNAQQQLQTKEAELLQPIVDAAKEAIQAVAKENGYTYIFDSGVGVLLYQPESDDILPLVKAKLNLK